MGLDAHQVQARLQYHVESERHPIPEVDAVVSRRHCPELVLPQLGLAPFWNYTIFG